MEEIEYALLQARAKQIVEESRMFIEVCRNNVLHARSLCDDTARLSDEAMILKEERLADKCKSLAIYNLAKEFYHPDEEDFNLAISIDDDTSMALKEIEEISQASIPDNNPMQSLRSSFLGLSFLPNS